MINNRVFPFLCIVVVIILPLLFYLRPPVLPQLLFRKAHRGVNIHPKIYRHIYNEKEKIDILILEGSQTDRSLDSQLLKNRFEEIEGQSINLVRLTIFGYAAELKALALKEILDRRKVKLVLIELHASDQWNLNCGTCINAQLPLWYAWLPHVDNRWAMNLYACSLLSSLRNIYVSLDSKMWPLRYVKSEFMNTHMKTHDSDLQEFNPEFERAIKEYSTQLPLNKLLHEPITESEFDLTSSNFNLENYYLEKMIEMSRSHGAKVAVIRSPLLIHDPNKLPILSSIAPTLIRRKVPILGFNRQTMLSSPHYNKAEEVFSVQDKWHLNLRGKTLATHLYYPGIASLLNEVKVASNRGNNTVKKLGSGSLP